MSSEPAEIRTPEEDERYWAELCYLGAKTLEQWVNRVLLLCISVYVLVGKYHPLPHLRYPVVVVLVVQYAVFIIPRLGIWISKRREYPLVDNVGKEIINACLSFVLYVAAFIGAIAVLDYGGRMSVIILTVVLVIALPFLLVRVAGAAVEGASRRDPTLEYIHQGQPIRFRWAIRLLR